MRRIGRGLIAWPLRMEGYGGPAQPSPTIAQCLNGGYGGRLVFRGWSITRRIWSIAAPDGWLVTLTGATETVGSRLSEGEEPEASGIESVASNVRSR